MRRRDRQEATEARTTYYQLPYYNHWLSSAYMVPLAYRALSCYEGILRLYYLFLIIFKNLDIECQKKATCIFMLSIERFNYKD